MKDLGETDEFLGVLITRNLVDRALHFSQTEFIDKVLESFGFCNAKPSATPM